VDRSGWRERRLPLLIHILYQKRSWNKQRDVHTFVDFVFVFVLYLFW
jgi:hypothetical protein